MSRELTMKTEMTKFTDIIRVKNVNGIHKGSRVKNKNKYNIV